jgi:myosin regulatory light chain 12
MKQRYVDAKRGRVADLMNAKIERLLKGSFTDRQGNFNYREWVKVLRVNDG